MSKVTAALLVLSVIVSESQMRQQYKRLLIIYPKMDILVEGYRLPNKALTNHELVEAAKALNITNFKGVFMRNNLPKTPRKPESGIRKLDYSNGSGTHWVCWWKKHYTDSYGVQPPLELICYLKSPVYNNTEEIQPRGTVICGHICLYVLKITKSEREYFQTIINNLHH